MTSGIIYCALLCIICTARGLQLKFSSSFRCCKTHRLREYLHFRQPPLSVSIPEHNFVVSPLYCEVEHHDNVDRNYENSTLVESNQTETLSLLEDKWNTLSQQIKESRIALARLRESTSDYTKDAFFRIQAQVHEFSVSILFAILTTS
jgi:hypothetical protein